jgi:excisionase family DNA binding protein
LADEEATHSERLAYRVNEAAELLGISRSSIYVLFENGQLPFVKVAGRRLVRRSDLLELLQKAER